MAYAGFSNPNEDASVNISDVLPDAKPQRLNAGSLSTATRSNFTLHMPNLSNLQMRITQGRQFRGGNLTVWLICAILVALVTIIFLASAVGYLNRKIPPPYPDLCSTRNCLETAGMAESYMNTSADPCQDFYQYACGQFAQQNPIPQGKYDVNQWSLLQQKNDKRILDLLEGPVKYDRGATDKVRLFYKACKNDYFKSIRGSTPLLADFQKLGGWDALAVMSDNFDLNKALQDAHAKYGVHAFFTIDVSPDQDSTKPGHPAYNYTIELNVPKLEMGHWTLYLKNDTASKYKHAAYRRYIKKVIQQMRNEVGGSTKVMSGLDAAVNDIMVVETAIAQAIANTNQQKGVYKPINYLDKNYGKRLRFYDLFQAYFKEAQLEKTKIIHLHEEQYIKMITHDFVDVLSDRLINAYLMWRIASQFVNDMGWQYVHARREWVMAKYNYHVEFMGTYRWCQHLVKKHFGNVISYMFVNRHFGQEDNRQLNMIGSHVKSVLVERVKKYPWMSSAAKKAAIKKIKSTKDKFGYPTWLDIKKAVDDYYARVDISFASTHYANMVQLYSFQRYQQTMKIIKEKVDRDYWPEHIFDVNADYDVSNNYLYVPAGVLQSPFYTLDIPMFWTYGSMGRILGSEVIRAIDDEGRGYDETGVVHDWYDQPTNDSFNKLKTCYAQQFANETILKWKVSHTSTLARYGWRELAGLKTAHLAYQQFVEYIGKKEPVLPGFEGHTANQNFFISYAQTFCYNRPDWVTLWYAENYFDEPEQMILRKILSQSPEFASAFKCPYNQPCDDF